MSDRDRMKRWESFIDEQIKRAIGDGDMHHLPGAGMPLNLDADDTNVPEELRMAYKIMQDNDNQEMPPGPRHWPARPRRSPGHGRPKSADRAAERKRITERPRTGAPSPPKRRGSRALSARWW